jgi:hypothetical protein
MTPTLTDFCPSVDALTLLQFRSEALQALRTGPSHQEHQWREAHALITVLLARAAAGPVKLEVR